MIAESSTETMDTFKTLAKQASDDKAQKATLLLKVTRIEKYTQVLLQNLESCSTT